MTGIETTAILGEIVDRHPSLARELERLKLDYCCGGQQTLTEACENQGLDPSTIVVELTRLTTTESPGDWTKFDLLELIDHLETTHHQYLKKELPRLSSLTKKVQDAHGSNHPELSEVAAVFQRLHEDMDPHLMKEERVLFPMVKELAAANSRPMFHCGSVANPISVMLIEHDQAGALLDQLVALTDTFRVPTDGCASFKACYEGLAELNTDTRMHIHKENNVLFPAVVTLENQLPTFVD